MATLSEALSTLDDAGRIRVLTWAASKFDVRLTKPGGRGSGGASAGGEETGSERLEFAGFVDLFDAANPRTDADRAMVAAYWFQVIQNNASWQSQTLNSALKDLGYGVGNITDALQSLQDRRPARVRQVSKAGSSRQARKTYKLTTAGITSVRAMLGGTAEEGEE